MLFCSKEARLYISPKFTIRGWLILLFTVIRHCFIESQVWIMVRLLQDQEGFGT